MDFLTKSIFKIFSYLACLHLIGVGGWSFIKHILDYKIYDDSTGKFI
jgi:hypothetical protein